MLGFLVRRIISGVLVIITISIAVFVLFYKGPSDPAEAFCDESKCTADRLQAITDNLQLDRPIHTQYFEYMGGIFTGREIPYGSIKVDCSAPCFGISFKYQGVEVWDQITEYFPASLSVAAGGAVVFLIIGLASGIIAARNRGTLIDKGVVSLSLIINAMPYYLLALLAYLYLISQWQIMPMSGYFSPFEEGPIAWIKGMLVAWLCIGLTYSTQYARFSRGAMIEALNEDYTRTARAKGLSDGAITFKHAFRAAVVPIVTIFGLDFATLLAGTIFTEKIFDIRGIGLINLEAIGNQDLPIVLATVILGSAFLVMANIVVDFLYSIIDPRVRL